MWPIIELGGLIFWFLIAAFIVLECALIHNDRKGWATTSLIAFIIGLHVVTRFNLYHFITDNWPHCLYGVGVYFLIGITWGFIKWEFFVGKRRDEFDDFKTDWLGQRNIASKNVPADLQSDWAIAVVQKYTRRSYCDDVYLARYTPQSIKDLVVPPAHQSKAMIVGWMSYWPFSFLSTLLYDIILDIWGWVYRYLSTIFEMRAKARFAGVEHEFSTTPKKDDRKREQQD